MTLKTRLYTRKDDEFTPFSKAELKAAIYNLTDELGDSTPNLEGETIEGLYLIHNILFSRLQRRTEGE